jgi:cobalt-zinc-cadmium efflux system outer membrane protein
MLIPLPRTLRVLGLSTLLGTTLVAFAQPPATLKQAFDNAWARQPEAAAAELRHQAAAARQAAAEAWTADAPALEIAAKTDRLNRNQGSRELELGIALPLWLPGERGHARSLAAAEMSLVESQQAAAAWRLAGALREAWWGWQRARLELGLAQARADSAARLAQDVARRVGAGDLARSDQHQADGALAAAQAELAESRAAQAQAELALRSLAVDDMAPSDAGEALPTDAVAGEHPTLRELRDRLRLAERARDLAAVQTRANPELTLGATRDRGGFGESYGQTVNIGLRFPLGAGGAGQARRASAAAEHIEAQTALSLAQQRLAAEITNARLRLEAAQAVASAAARRAQLARETQGFVDKSFRLGQSDLPGRLRVELESFEAERQSERARLGVHQAISALRQALGLLPQ